MTWVVWAEVTITTRRVLEPRLRARSGPAASAEGWTLCYGCGCSLAGQTLAGSPGLALRCPRPAHKAPVPPSQLGRDGPCPF